MGQRVGGKRTSLAIYFRAEKWNIPELMLRTRTTKRYAKAPSLTRRQGRAKSARHDSVKPLKRLFPAYASLYNSRIAGGRVVYLCSYPFSVWLFPKNRPHLLEPFLPFFPSRATPAAREGATPGSCGCAEAWKCLVSGDFSGTSPSPPPLRPVCFPFAAAPYPAGTGRASIRHTMLPNRRRVRWL